MGQNLNGTIRQGGQTLTGVLGSPSRSLSASVRVVGRGIADIDIDDDGYMTVTYTDGTTWVSDESLIGPQGDPGSTGPAGTGISSVSVDADGYITVTYTNGQSQTMATSVKGPQGPSGQDGTSAGFGTPTATIDANTGTPSVTVSATGPDTAKVFAFDFKNLKGQAGQNGTNGTNGAAAGFGTVSATVDANTGTPSVEVTSSGPDTAKEFSFAFHNLKGQSGSGSGTVTQVSTGVGLTGGPVTSSGTIKAKLKSETASSLASESVSSTSGRQYAVNPDSSGYLSVNVPWTDTKDYTQLSNKPTIPSKVSDLQNDSGFISSETDPVFSASAAAGITSSDITTWDGKSDKVNWYGTCSTTASTTAKTVTCSGFVKRTGAVIAITFSTANTASAPTLNINSTTATATYKGNAVTSSSNPLKWDAGDTLTFMYDGSYYKYLSTSNDFGKQDALVSGTNIKTINSTSLLGSGDISVQSAITSTTVSITVANWNATTTCTKSVTGVTSSNNVIVTPAPASINTWNSNGVYCSAQGSGTLTFTASTTPSADMTVNVMIIN